MPFISDFATTYFTVHSLVCSSCDENRGIIAKHLLTYWSLYLFGSIRVVLLIEKRQDMDCKKRGSTATNKACHEYHDHLICSLDLSVYTYPQFLMVYLSATGGMERKWLRFVQFLALVPHSSSQKAPLPLPSLVR